jgi:hypothetical protein
MTAVPKVAIVYSANTAIIRAGGMVFNCFMETSAKTGAIIRGTHSAVIRAGSALSRYRINTIAITIADVIWAGIAVIAIFGRACTYAIIAGIDRARIIVIAGAAGSGRMHAGRCSTAVIVGAGIAIIAVFGNMRASATCAYFNSAKIEVIVSACSAFVAGVLTNAFNTKIRGTLIKIFTGGTVNAITAKAYFCCAGIAIIGTWTEIFRIMEAIAR